MIRRRADRARGIETRRQPECSKPTVRSLRNISKHKPWLIARRNLVEIKISRIRQRVGASQTTMGAQLINGTWTAPEVSSFSGQFSDRSPTVSPDGTRLLFASTRPSHAPAPAGSRSRLGGRNPGRLRRCSIPRDNSLKVPVSSCARDRHPPKVGWVNPRVIV